MRQLLQFNSLLVFGIFTFLTSTVFSQSNQPKQIGLGIVKLTKPNDFRDFKMPTGLYLDLAETKICTSNEIMAFNSVPEVGIYNFVCLEILDSKYKVLINDTEIGYLPKTDLYDFQSWEDLLVEKGVRRITEGNPIREGHSIDSKVIQYSCDNEYFKVDEVIESQGEYWIHVNYWSDCKDRKDVVSLMSSGYIKWRTSNELLVSVFVGC